MSTVLSTSWALLNLSVLIEEIRTGLNTHCVMSKEFALTFNANISVIHSLLTIQAIAWTAIRTIRNLKSSSNKVWHITVQRTCFNAFMLFIVKNQPFGTVQKAIFSRQTFDTLILSKTISTSVSANCAVVSIRICAYLAIKFTSISNLNEREVTDLNTDVKLGFQFLSFKS